MDSKFRMTLLSTSSG